MGMSWDSVALFCGGVLFIAGSAAGALIYYGDRVSNKSEFLGMIFIGIGIILFLALLIFTIFAISMLSHD